MSLLTEKMPGYIPIRGTFWKAIAMTRTVAQPAQPRAVNPRRWRTLALASATATLAAIPAMVQAEPPLLAPALDAAARMGATLWLADGGEAGESGTVASGDETVDFLAGLLQIEGHLNAGFTLWAAGDRLDAQAHMGHPLAEVYDGIEGQLSALGQPSFRAVLEKLVDTAAAGGDQVSLDAIRADVMAAVTAAREAAVAKDPRDDFTAIIHVIRKAGDEWSEGVVSGQIAELHEYQDAWGFVQAARERATQLASSTDPATAQAATATLAALDDLTAVLPAVAPTGPIGGDPSFFAGAAARIELAAFKVK
jgi:hypothetical protein